ncbi:hypothetical protein KAS08_05085 [Candidatus Pacearchaeota archaeon]|nr:hypothetical protein [Candidatus Pacearchaeota archaeon]
MEGRFNDRQPREMHDAVCSKCGNNCQVPFKPTQGKDVLCGDCFKANRPPRRDSGRSFGGRNNNRNNFDRQPREMHKTKCTKCGNDCEVPFKPTPGKDVLCGDCFKASRN